MIILSIFSIKSQTNGFHPDHVDKSLVILPEQYKFLLSGDFKNDEYTGKPNISIAIHEISTGDIQIPINLVYNPGGIRVAEEASCVGLGWDLSFASVVQIKNDKDDLSAIVFQRPDYFKHFTPNISEWTTDQMLYDHSIDTSLIPLWYIDNNWMPKNNSLYNFENLFENPAMYDCEFDIFKVNLFGESFEFYINPVSEPQLLNDKGYKVEKVNSGTNTVWHIIGPDGKKYKFEELITIQSLPPSWNGQPMTYATSTLFNFYDLSQQTVFGGGGVSGYYPDPAHDTRIWQISSVEDTKGNTVSFNYTDDTYVQYDYRFGSVWRLCEGTGIQLTNAEVWHNRGPWYYGVDQFTRPKVDQGPPYYFIGYRENMEVTRTIKTYLQSVTYNETVLEFTYSSRNDYENSKKLEYITRYESSRIEQLAKFDYDYFESIYNGYGYDIPFKTKDELTKRLRLKSIQMNNHPPYIFTYDHTQFPPKNSTATDYWGYYNGSLFNNTISPNISRIADLTEGYLELALENRSNHSAHQTFALAGTLTEIKFPTGGRTIFEYELNEDQEFTFSGSGFQFIIPNYDYEPYILKNNLQIYSSDNNLSINQDSKWEPFYIIDCEFPGKFYGLFSMIYNGGNSCNPSSIQLNSYIRVYSLNKSYLGEDWETAVSDWNNWDYHIYSNHASLEKEMKFGWDSNSNTLINYENEPFFIDVSNDNVYCVITEFDDNCFSYTPKGWVNITINEFKSSRIDNDQTLLKGNGLRVKNILSFTDGGNIAAYKDHFEYFGGKSMLRPVFAYGFSDMAYFFEPEHSILSMYSNIEVSSGNLLQTTINGSLPYFGYDRVIKSRTTITGNLGRDEFTFNNHRLKSQSINNTQLSLPSILTNALNGKLISRCVYTENNKKIMEEVIDYKVITTENPTYGFRHTTLGLFASLVNWDNPHLEDHHPRRIIGYYPVYSYYIQPISSKTYSYYFGNYTQSVLTETKFDYYNLGLLKEIITNSSDNSSRRTFYHYPINNFSPNEFFTSSQIINQLRSKNIINKPLRIQEWSGQSLVSNNIISYNLFNNNMLLPSDIRLGTTSDVAFPELFQHTVIKKYDNYGNITEFEKQDGINVVLLWGYNYRNLVCRVENSSFEQVMSSIGMNYEELQQQNSDNLEVIFDLLRSKLEMKNAMITSFTHDAIYGVTSKTDANNFTTRYDYDPLGRLKQIRDYESNILKFFEYNYAH